MTGRRIAAAAFVLMLTACGGGSLAGSTPDGGITDVGVGPLPAQASTPGDRDSEEDSLRQARFRWADVDEPGYDLVVTGSCECTSSGVVTVRVRDRRPTVVGADPAPAGTPTTVKALLQVVGTELRRSDSVTVTYHPDGVPLRIVADRDDDAIDDEMTWTVAYTPRR